MLEFYLDWCFECLRRRGLSCEGWLWDLLLMVSIWMLVEEFGRELSFEFVELSFDLSIEFKC